MDERIQEANSIDEENEGIQAANLNNEIAKKKIEEQKRAQTISTLATIAANSGEHML